MLTTHLHVALSSWSYTSASTLYFHGVGREILPVLLLIISKRNTSNACTGGADKSLARPGRKQATATNDFDVHVSYL
jgi:hypothetical protein